MHRELLFTGVRNNSGISITVSLHDNFLRETASAAEKSMTWMNWVIFFYKEQGNMNWGCKLLTFQGLCQLEIRGEMCSLINKTRYFSVPWLDMLIPAVLLNPNLIWGVAAPDNGAGQSFRTSVVHWKDHLWKPWVSMVSPCPCSMSEPFSLILWPSGLAGPVNT